MNPSTVAMPLPPPAHRPAIDVQEARFALRVTQRLQEGADTLPHDVSERLRVARDRAVAQARLRRQAVAASAVVADGGGSAVLGGGPSFWVRLASALPLLLLLLGLLMIQDHNDREQITTAAEIDSALLADELPPAAYGDPGFFEYVRSRDDR